MCNFGSSSATSTSTTSPPPEVMEMYKYLTEQGKALQQRNYQPYQGQMVADLNNYQQQGIDLARQSAQIAQPYYQNAAQGTFSAMQGYRPEAFQQGVGTYMSPYLQNALTSVTNQMQNVNQQQQQQMLGNAIKTGAFGGDRGKIAQAALMNQQNLALGQTLGQMAQTGYQDAARNYMAGLAGQGAMASQLGNLGSGAQTSAIQGAQGLTQAGGIPYQIEQAKLASQYGQYAQEQAYPWQTLGYLANMASGLGAGQGGTSSTTTPGPNLMGQVFGGLMALGSLPWGSDERLKENMEPVGKTFDGQNIYKFNYKNDGHTMLGLSAQEVEKRHPEAVVKDGGGMRMVDYQTATEDAADRGKFNLGGSSMGGLVPAGQERQPYATKGAVGILPYIEDPLYELMASYSKVPLVSYIPEGLAVKAGTRGIPEAPSKYEDTPSEIVKGVQAMTPTQKANLVSNLNDVLSDYGLGANPNTSGMSRSTQQALSAYGGLFARGGIVPRSHHADGQKVELPDIPYGSDKPTIAEHLTGMQLSPDARAGLMAAGLGMMASRSPFFGTAVGEGGLAGLNTYYNAIKNKYDVQKNLAELGLRGREVSVQEAGIPIRTAEYNLNAYEAATKVLPMLRAQAAAILSTPGAELPQDLKDQIKSLNSIIGRGPPSFSGASSTFPETKGSVSTPLTEPQTNLNAVPQTDLKAKPATPETTPSGVVVPSPDQGTVVKPQASVEVKEPVQASASLEAQKSGMNLPPTYDPDIMFAQAKKLAEAGLYEESKAMREKATQILLDISKNGGVMVDGKFVPLPNYQETMAAREAAKTVAQKKEEAKFDLVETMTKDGTTVLKPKSEILGTDKEVGAGAGSPPGEVANKTADETVKKLPEWQLKAREKISEDETQMGKDFLKRQNSLSRLDTLLDILSTYQTGSFSEIKSQIVNKLFSAGIPVTEENMKDAANFEKFTKGAIQEVFNSLPGGRILQSEIQGLSKANANAKMLPESNAKILGDARAVANYENKYTRDYLEWRKQNPNAYRPTDIATFDTEWASKNDLNKFKAEEARKIGYIGQAIPEKPTHGKAYFVPSAKEVRFWDKNADAGGGVKGGWVKYDPLAQGQ